METGAASNDVVRCKTLELDLSTRELFKDGQKLKLHGHPIDVLAMLLEKPGELVTREQLRKKLWPETTYVDFEHGLNSTINRLRDALGDHADEPQFIETLPRLGYRFLIPLEETLESAQVSSQLALKSPESNISAEAALAASHAAQPAYKSANSHRILRQHWKRVILGLMFVAISLSTMRWYLRRPLSAPRITDFKQLTNDGQVKLLVGTDGGRIYFNRAYPWSMAQIGIAGGDAVAVPAGLPNPSLLDVSQDGSALLIASVSGLWSLQVPGGALRHLSDTRVRCAAWSADSRSIVYSTDKGDISIVRSDGSDAHRILDAQVPAPCSNEDNLAWSPDGKSIRFAANSKIWEISSDGSGLHPLLPKWRPSARQFCGRWTSDGSFFFFWSQTPSPLNGQIWALDERHKFFRNGPVEPIQLTPGLVRWSRPIPSKDGKTIFARGTIDRAELVRYDNKSRDLQPFLGGISAAYVRFSPDQKFIAYVTTPEGILWRTNRDGGNPVQLTSASLRVELPKWSPDGTQILFDGTDANGQTKIYSVSSQGGAPHPFLPAFTSGLSEPFWSPDGHKIVFCKGGLGDPNNDIRILDLESHQFTTLPESIGLFSPIWSPDGRSILALDSVSFALKLFDLKTQQWSVLVKEGVGWPNWSRDGKFIYFFEWINEMEVYRIPLSGGTVERVAVLPGFHGGLNGFMSLDPQNTPVFLRSTGTDEIYALTLGTK